MEHYEVLSDMFIGIFYGTEYSDFALPIGICLWSLIILIKIYDIDLNDHMTMVTFILWNMFSATVLCFAIPQVYTDLSEMKFHFIILSLIGVVSAFLWNIRRKEKVNFKRMQLRKKLNE